MLSSDRCIPLLGSGVECDEEAPVGEFVNVNVDGRFGNHPRRPSSDERSERADPGGAE